MSTDSTDRILGSDAAVAVGSFEPDGPHGYRAKTGGPLRATRAEAEADYRAWLDEQNAERRSAEARS